MQQSLLRHQRATVNPKAPRVVARCTAVSTAAFERQQRHGRLDGHDGDREPTEIARRQIVVSGHTAALLQTAHNLSVAGTPVGRAAARVVLPAAGIRTRSVGRFALTAVARTLDAGRAFDALTSAHSAVAAPSHHVGPQKLPQMSSAVPPQMISAMAQPGTSLATFRSNI